MSLPGAKAHSARLKRISSPQTVERVGRALFKAGKIIESEAKLLITTGAVSGKSHVASKPGEPPNNDSGGLKNGIETTQPAPLVVHVTSNAPYAVPLEVGTSKMAARPHMKPAVARKRDEMTRYIRQVVKNAIDGSN